MEASRKSALLVKKPLIEKHPRSILLSKKPDATYNMRTLLSLDSASKDGLKLPQEKYAKKSVRISSDSVREEQTQQYTNGPTKPNSAAKFGAYSVRNSKSEGKGNTDIFNTKSEINTLNNQTLASGQVNKKQHTANAMLARDSRSSVGQRFVRRKESQSGQANASLRNTTFTISENSFDARNSRLTTGKDNNDTGNSKSSIERSNNESKVPRLWESKPSKNAQQYSNSTGVEKSTSYKRNDSGDVSQKSASSGIPSANSGKARAFAGIGREVAIASFRGSLDKLHQGDSVDKKTPVSKSLDQRNNDEKRNQNKSIRNYNVQTAVQRKQDLRLRKRILIPSKAEFSDSNDLLPQQEPEKGDNSHTSRTQETQHTNQPSDTKTKEDPPVNTNSQASKPPENQQQYKQSNSKEIKTQNEISFKGLPRSNSKTGLNISKIKPNIKFTTVKKKDIKLKKLPSKDIIFSEKSTSRQNTADDLVNPDDLIGYDTRQTKDFLLVAAIDFGNTYSDYAFQSTEEYRNNCMSVTVKSWSNPHYNTVKTSTNILFDENRQFHSFGFEAEAKYLRLLENDDSNVQDWYYFTRFKMFLYQNIHIGTNTKLKDSQGKLMPAIKVFSAAIAFLKADLLAMCHEHHPDVDQTNIQWVITVPALWNDKVKTFMREAASKAGIPNDRMVMALEPEAASLYCIEWMKRSDLTDLGRGEKFMVLDAGGGTVDIAIHQIHKNGQIREIHKASGGDWGGTQVDKEFNRLLIDIMGRDVFTELQKRQREYLHIFNSFEKAKRRDFSTVAHGKILLNFPKTVNKLCWKMKQKEINEIISENSRLKNSIRLHTDKLEIDLTLFKSLFTSAIQDILKHLSTLFHSVKVKDVTTILMVGGYSECYLLQEAVRNKYNSLRVIVPRDSALAVLKGAVLYGYSPHIFQTRISTFTYGIETTEPFSKDHHPSDNKIYINGKVHCDKIFCIHVQDGENITLGKSVSKMYKTIDPEQTHMEFIVFASFKRSPRFTDEEGCFKVGTLTVDVTNISKNKYGEKQIKLELIYGGTELEAIATDVITGKTSQEHFALGRVTGIGKK